MTSHLEDALRARSAAITSLSVLIEEHNLTDAQDADDHPYKGQCECGKWSYMHSNHLAEIIVDRHSATSMERFMS